MPRLSLRELKKRKTREKLIEIANRRFLEKGFEKTTIDEIVLEAELSQRTFFRYFATKEAVVFWDFDRRIDQLQQLLAEEGIYSSPFDRINRVFRLMAEEYHENRVQLFQEYKIVMSSKFLTAMDIEQDLAYERLFATSLQYWKQAPCLSSSKANLIAAALFGAIRSVMGTWFEDECRQNLVELSEDLFLLSDVLEKGIANR